MAKTKNQYLEVLKNNLLYSLIDETGFAIWAYQINEEYFKGEPAEKILKVLSNSTLIECNDKFLELHNAINKKSLLGKRLSEVSLFDESNYFDYLDNFLSNNYRTRNLILENNRNNEYKCFEVSAIAHFDENNKFIMLTGSSIDRTELYRTKKVLSEINFVLDEQNKILTEKIDEIEEYKGRFEEENEIYKSLFFDSPAPKFIINPINYKILEINNAALELFEVEHDENLRLLDLIDSANFMALSDYLQEHNGSNKTTFKGYTKSSKRDLYVQILSKRINFRDKSALLIHIIDLTDKITSNQKEKELTNKIEVIRENLLETETKYKELIDESPFGIIIHQDNKIVYNNRIAQNLLGADENQLIGSSIFNIIHKDYHELEKERTRMVSESSEYTEQVREIFSRLNGESFFTEVITFPTEYNGKKAVQILFNDITEQINYQKSLIDSEERYRVLFDSSKDYLIITDLEGNILDANQAAIEKFNYSKNQIKTFTLYSLLIQDTFSFVEDPYVKILTDNSFNGKCFGKTSQNIEFIAEVFFTKVYLDSNERIFISVRDITIEENSKRKIQESRRESNEIIENLAVPVSISNFESGKLIYYSTKFREIFGDKITSSDFSSFELYKDPDDAKHLRNLLLSINKIQNFEVELIDRNRKIIVGLFSTSKITFRGQTCLLTSLLDITDRKKYESELKNRDRLLEELSDISKIGGWEYIIGDDLLIWTSQTYIIHNSKLGQNISLEDSISFYHPEDREKVYEYFVNLINYGNDFETEVRLRPIDKEYIWVKVIGSSIKENSQIRRVSGTIQDINQTKINELQIKEYSYSMSLAAKAANFGIWDWDIVNDKMTWDSTLWNIFEVPETKIKDVHFWKKFTYLDDWVKIKDTMIKALKKQSDFEIEFRIVTKNKQLKYIQSFAYVEFENDRAIRMIGVNWDVTKEKLAEIQLEESLQKFETLYNNSPVMLYSFDRKGIIISVSNFWLQTMGYTRQEVIGRKTTDFLTSKSKKLANDFVLPKFFKTGNVNYVYYELVKKNGDVVDVEFSAISERDDEGNIIRSLAVMIDVTERNKAQKESENKTKRLIEFRKALDVAAFVVFTTTTGLIKYTNQNFNILNKKDYNELINQNFVDLIDVGQSNFEKDKFLKSISNLKIWHGEIKLKDNDVAWLQTTAIPIFDEYSKSNEILIISFEITRLIQAENKLLNLNKTLEDRVKQRTEELVNLNKDKDNILSMVSHDLKNPLTGIILASDIIKHQSEKHNDKKLYDVAEKISRTSYKMIDIIKNLLELNAVESGKIQTNFTYVDLTQILKQTVNDAKLNAERKLQEIHLINSDEEFAVYIDKKLLVQVLDNLISNAIKFTHKEKNINIELHTNENDYSISVSDEGIGIADEDIPKLFQKFSRLKSKPTAGEDSTGLGLSIVKQLVEIMNGKVEVESKLGVGTKFTIKFNRHQVNII
jgi:PAS domain S-box-containing protein